MCGERCKVAQEKDEQAQTQETSQENQTPEKKQINGFHGPHHGRIREGKKAVQEASDVFDKRLNTYSGKLEGWDTLSVFPGGHDQGQKTRGCMLSRKCSP